MVTAGVYLLARSHVLFELAPRTLEVVAVIGAATAFLAATIGLAQNDIKRVLAYSTVSQLGYMFMACGVGAFGAGIFHLMTHAFFKALLFLGSGSVIHALSGEQDMRKMGGLASRLPWTHGTMVVATLASAGVPFFSGFFSKDEILAKAFGNGHPGIWAAGILGAALTAFYMTRLYVLTFQGPSRLTHEAEHHLHESPPSMIVPLAILAVLSFAGGYVGMPFQEGGHAFERWLRPVLESGVTAPHELSRGAEWALLLVSVVVAITGILLALRTYPAQPGAATALRARLEGLHRLLENKYWVEEFYDTTVVRPFVGISEWMWRVWDARVIDGAVNGTGQTFEVGSSILKLVQTGFVGTYAPFFTLGVVALFLHFLISRCPRCPGSPSLSSSRSSRACCSCSCRRGRSARRACGPRPPRRSSSCCLCRSGGASSRASPASSSRRRTPGSRRSAPATTSASTACRACSRCSRRS